MRRQVFFLTAGSNDKLKDVLVLPFEVPFQGLAVVQSHADDQGETGAGFEADTALLADGIIKRVALSGYLPRSEGSVISGRRRQMRTLEPTRARPAQIKKIWLEAK